MSHAQKQYDDSRAACLSHVHTYIYNLTHTNLSHIQIRHTHKSSTMTHEQLVPQSGQSSARVRSPVYIYVRTYIRMCASPYICMCVHAVFMYVRTYGIYMCIYTYACVKSPVYICVCIYINKYRYIYIYIYIHIYIYIYMYIYTCIHTHLYMFIYIYVYQ